MSRASADEPAALRRVRCSTAIAWQLRSRLDPVEDAQRSSSVAFPSRFSTIESGRVRRVAESSGTTRGPQLRWHRSPGYDGRALPNTLGLLAAAVSGAKPSAEVNSCQFVELLATGRDDLAPYASLACTAKQRDMYIHLIPPLRMSNPLRNNTVSAAKSMC